MNLYCISRVMRGIRLQIRETYLIPPTLCCDFRIDFTSRLKIRDCHRDTIDRSRTIGLENLPKYRKRNTYCLNRHDQSEYHSNRYDCHTYPSLPHFTFTFFHLNIATSCLVAPWHSCKYNSCRIVYIHKISFSCSNIKIVDLPSGYVRHRPLLYTVPCDYLRAVYSNLRCP